MVDFARMPLYFKKGVFVTSKLEVPIKNCLFFVKFETDYIKLERAVEKIEKLKSFKLESLLLGSFHLSWKVPIEVGKFSCRIKLSKIFQLRLELSNFIHSNFISNFLTFRFFKLPFPTTYVSLFDAKSHDDDIFCNLKIFWDKV